MLSYYYYRQKKLSAKRSGGNPPFLQEVLRTPQDKPAYAGADSLYSIPYPSLIFKGRAGRGICTGAVPLYTHLPYTECKKQLRGKCVCTPRSFFVLKCRRNSHAKYAFRRLWIAGPGGPGVKKRQRNGKAATLPFLCGYLRNIPTQPGPRRWTCMDYTTFATAVEYPILVQRPYGHGCGRAGMEFFGVRNAGPFPARSFLRRLPFT